MSLRLKLVLALLLSGLTAVLAVGGVAYLELHRKFASLQARQALASFRSEVQEYLKTHQGRWPADGDMSEFLGALMDRERRRHAVAVAIAPQELPDRAQPPPPPGPGSRPGAQAMEPTPGGPVRPEPFYRFVLTDADYLVLLGAGRYDQGRPLPPPGRALAEPVSLDGRTVAYVSIEGALAPGPEDEAYLRIMRQALLYGGLGALALLLLLGLLLGQGLSADLRRLTTAVRGMQAGALRQRVLVRGGGEVAALSAAFNGMSEALASGAEALRASHATITQQAAQLRELSLRDALTGLYNRRHFDAALPQLFELSCRHDHALTVVVADIDHFKRINDGHSHAVGDAVLRQVAQLLRDQLRASDLLARWGGEEFVIALPETPLAAAAALCEKLRQSVAAHDWSAFAPDLQVSLSFGLCAELQAGSAAAMLARADAQLYRAKQGGRNRVCHA